MHRWKEEFTLVKHEMEWTTRYFLHRARLWISRQETGNRPGPNAYAARQSAQWKQLTINADHLFQAVNTEYVTLVVM